MQVSGTGLMSELECLAARPVTLADLQAHLVAAGAGAHLLEALAATTRSRPQLALASMAPGATTSAAAVDAGGEAASMGGPALGVSQQRLAFEAGAGERDAHVLLLDNYGTTAIFYQWQQGRPQRATATVAGGETSQCVPDAAAAGAAAASVVFGGSPFYQHDMRGSLLPGEVREFRWISRGCHGKGGRACDGRDGSATNVRTGADRRQENMPSPSSGAAPCCLGGNAAMFVGSRCRIAG